MRSVLAVALLCFVVLAASECLPRLDSDYFDSNSGDTTIEPVQTTNNLPLEGAGARCQGVLALFPDEQICCNSATLDKIEMVANNIGNAMTQLEQRFTTAISRIDILGPNSNLTAEEQQELNSFPKIKAAIEKLDAALDRFRDVAPERFSRCVRTVERYIGGAMCSICRPDFLNGIVTVFRNETIAIRTWKWRTSTCDSLVAGCVPLFDAYDAVLYKFFEIFTELLQDPQLQPLFGNDTEFDFGGDMANSILRPCVFAAALVNGVDDNGKPLPDADPCRTAICRTFVRGLRTPVFFNVEDLDNINFLGELTGPGKRNNGPLTALKNAFKRSTSSLAGALKKRQSLEIGGSDQSRYTADAVSDPIAEIEGSKVGNLDTTGAANTVMLSVAAVVAAIVMFF